MKATPLMVNEALTLINSSAITEKVPIVNLLRRPHIGMEDLKKLDRNIEEKLNKYSVEIQQQVEVAIKYETYIEREQKLAEKIESLESYIIRTDFDYDRVKALSSEAREKLKRIRPETIGQMSRISGVSPADVSILTVYLGK
jgi:tRNA uridine 5-carboxymethylaminomethyl modification enzyme